MEREVDFRKPRFLARVGCSFAGRHTYLMENLEYSAVHSSSCRTCTRCPQTQTLEIEMVALASDKNTLLPRLVLQVVAVEISVAAEI